MKEIVRKWKDNQLKWFNAHFDENKSRDDNVQNCLVLVAKNEWATFIDCRIKQETKAFYY